MCHTNPQCEFLPTLSIVCQFDILERVEENLGHLLKILTHWVALINILLYHVVHVHLLLLLLILLFKLINHVRCKLVI